MAGDWIKFEKSTLDKPEIVQMADLLGTSEDDVIGKLLRVWSWFDSQSRDGNAGSVTGVTLHRFIDRLVSSQGFAASMVKAGWLTDSGLPHFDRHNGETSKKRALTQKRAQKHRNALVTQNVTLQALPEKRREDINPLPPFGKSTSTPVPSSKAVTKTQAILEEQRKAAESASPPPPDVAELLAKARKHEPAPFRTVEDGSSAIEG